MAKPLQIGLIYDGDRHKSLPQLNFLVEAEPEPSQSGASLSSELYDSERGVPL